VDLELSPEQRAVVETTRAFVLRELVPHEDEVERSGRLAPELARRLRDRAIRAGLFAANMPEDVGGGGLDTLSWMLMERELGHTGYALQMYAVARPSRILLACNDSQRESHLLPTVAGERTECLAMTEPEAGSDLRGMRTRAVRDGSDWILNGSKMWITNGGIADVATVWAQTEEGIRGFLVPCGTPGFTTSDIKQKMSLRASVTSELSFDDVRLPASAQLPEARGLAGPLACLNEARFGILFGAVGAARDCLQEALSYADSRVQFGKPISAFQLTQKKLADMAVSVNTSMLLALHLGRLKDAGRIRPEQVSVGKLNNVREAIAVARECRTILGGNGISLEYSPLRHANNLESVLTYEGTNEIHTLVVGQALTGQAAYR
jgi:glutaryl-CoA dehydrogenase